MVMDIEDYEREKAEKICSGIDDNVWTFWIFICRTDISANADDSKFNMDQKAAAGL